MANIWENAKSILAGNLNSCLIYLIATFGISNPPETSTHEALIKAFQILSLKTTEFSNINPDFTAKIPVVSFNVGGKKTISRM